MGKRVTKTNHSILAWRKILLFLQEKQTKTALDKQTNFYRVKLSNYFESTILHWLLIYSILRKKQSSHYQCSGLNSYNAYLISLDISQRFTINMYKKKYVLKISHAFLSFICCFPGEVCSVNYLYQQLHMKEFKIMNSRNFLLQIFI